MRSGRADEDEARLRRVLESRYWRAGDARVVVEAWERSGLTQAEFARRHGVHVKRLGWWRGRLPRSAAAPASVTLLPVRIVEDPPRRGGCGAPPGDGGGTMEVAFVGGPTVRVGSAFDAGALRRLLDVLGC